MLLTARKCGGVFVVIQSRARIRFENKWWPFNGQWFTLMAVYVSGRRQIAEFGPSSA